MTALWAGPPSLTIHRTQLEAIRDLLIQGAADAADGLSSIHAPDSQVRVGRLGLCVLADFPSGAVFCDDDLSAGVLQRFDGQFSATALLALDPADALSWVRCHGSPSDPLATYRAIAEQLLRHLVGRLAVVFDIETQPGPLSLEEHSVVDTLLATHAPSDTVVLSLCLEVGTSALSFTAAFYLMVDPKRLAALLETLEPQPQS